MEVADHVIVLLHESTPEEALAKARKIHSLLASMQRLRICARCGWDYDPQSRGRARGRAPGENKYCSSYCCNRARDERHAPRKSELQRQRYLAEKLQALHREPVAQGTTTVRPVPRSNASSATQKDSPCRQSSELSDR